MPSGAQKMKKITSTIKQEDKRERLDTYVSSKSGLSRSYIQRLLKNGLILVNSQPEKSSYIIRQGDVIKLTIPDEPPLTLIPEDVPLDIVREDGHIIVVNKPPYMVVYPSAGHKNGTLLNALLSKCRKLASTGAPLRPGVVHRLDKETSGLIVLAKDNAAYSALVKKFKEHEIEKNYLALLYGRLKTDRGEIRTAIGRSISDRKKMSTKTRKGKEAVTMFEVIKRFKSATLAKVRIITGRTHQIRVHFAASGHPVLGDKTYGKKTFIKFGQKTINFPRQMLHAYSLKFEHPVTGEPLELTAPLPDDIKKAIEELSD
ncbi:MAG: RluA family pseudouridine synthase [Nitrospirota bacterium]